jgi:hypothetical protein
MAVVGVVAGMVAAGTVVLPSTDTDTGPTGTCMPTIGLTGTTGIGITNKARNAVTLQIALSLERVECLLTRDGCEGLRLTWPSCRITIWTNQRLEFGCQLAFARDALVWLVDALYLIFKFTVVLRQSFGDDIRAARHG